MKTKNAVAFWYNLKGNYDIVIFNNKRNLNKYANAYKEIYNNLEQEKITWAEFEALADNLAELMWDNIVKVEDGIFRKDITNNTIETYINDEKYKINIIDFLDYGV